MREREFHAHTPGPNANWHLLGAHLEAVASQAQTFAEPFGAGDLAYWVGLMHDLGKYNPEFQDYLDAMHKARPHRKVPHSKWGAAVAYKLRAAISGGSMVWKQMCLPIAGHHAGLTNGGTIAQDLDDFLCKRPEVPLLLRERIQELPTPPKLRLVERESTRQELFVRMVFSALVDADYLDTENHLEPQRTSRRGKWPGLPDLWERLERSQDALIDHAGKTRVNQIRREVYEACVEAASGPQGVYRLSVPTGGGKTRSGLAFALKHAMTHDMRRVIIAIPYTSIIDQTAKEYRTILGEESVLEHHSQLALPEDENEDPRWVRLRLATENWEAPVIVTTTVQLLESLFGNRPSRVRKLHNLARSVIVIDEVQTLPPGLLEPTVDALRALVEEYGVTLVLSTATQPAWEETPYLKAFQGVEVREIVAGYARHFEDLIRVRYEILPEPISWESLAKEIRDEPQIMVVLNTRKDALCLLDVLDGVPDVFHLSTLLCGAHRKSVLEKILVFDHSNYSG